MRSIFPMWSGSFRWWRCPRFRRPLPSPLGSSTFTGRWCRFSISGDASVSPPREHGLSAHLLVAQTARRVLAFPVDEVFGVATVAAEPDSPPGTVLPGIGHAGGIVTLPDGLRFIRDPGAFLSLDEERQLGEALEEQER